MTFDKKSGIVEFRSIRHMPVTLFMNDIRGFQKLSDRLELFTSFGKTFEIGESEAGELVAAFDEYHGYKK